MYRFESGYVSVHRTNPGQHEHRHVETSQNGLAPFLAPGFHKASEAQIARFGGQSSFRYRLEHEVRSPLQSPSGLFSLHRNKLRCTLGS
jgi:hypothetical protein